MPMPKSRWKNRRSFQGSVSRKMEALSGVKKPEVIGIIPARYGSTRFPGKPLADLGGLPVIQHVYRRASRSLLLSKVCVATDDKRIFDCVLDFGGTAVMTPELCSSGTDRAAHAAARMQADIVVNIQGDEPFIEPDVIDAAGRILLENPEARMGTLVAPLKDPESLMNDHTVKVIVNRKNEAVYFSRHPIPFLRDCKKETWINHFDYFRHVGIYSYTKEFLLEFSGWGSCPLEEAEKLEQLRALDHGVAIHTAVTDYEGSGIDVPGDLERARIRLMSQQPERTR